MLPTDALRPHLADMRSRAAALDDQADFPAEDVALLRSTGLLMAPLPHRFGGRGGGTEPAGTACIFELLRMLGQANPSVGRLFEAHVNAIRLTMRFGTKGQCDQVAEACRAGELFGLWVTDAPRAPVRLVSGALSGAKGPCSGAGHLARALVTVTMDDGTTRMALATLRGNEAVNHVGTRLLGMRAAANGTIQLDGLSLEGEALLGGPGDYLREPDFSTGAWRTMAVTLGVVDALVEAVRDQLRARGHDDAPLQLARYGKLLIAQGTAQLWTWQAAQCAESGTSPEADQVATVNLARIAVEAACFDAVRHVQQALGLGALVQPNAVERMVRDLMTYMRQPAADMVLTEAAQHRLCNP